MPAAPKYSSRELDLIRRLYADGAKLKRIALELGRGERGVRFKMNKMGLNTRRGGETAKRVEVRVYLPEAVCKKAGMRASSRGNSLSGYIRRLVTRDLELSP